MSELRDLLQQLAEASFHGESPLMIQNVASYFYREREGDKPAENLQILIDTMATHLEDYLFKTALLRVCDLICHYSQKSEYTGYIHLLSPRLPELLGHLVYMHEEREASGSSSVSAYFSDIKKTIREWKRYFPDAIPAILDAEKHLAEREQKATERNQRKIEILKKIEEDRDRVWVFLFLSLLILVA
jgi:hypothetical protein